MNENNNFKRSKPPLIELENCSIANLNGLNFLIKSNTPEPAPPNSSFNSSTSATTSLNGSANSLNVSLIHQ